MNNTVLERLKQEYNETLNRMQDLGDILAHCAEMDTNHCGQDAGSPCGCSAVAYDPNESQPVDLDDACCQAAYDPNESQPVDTAPMSLHELTGMQVVGAYPKGWKCKDCIFSEIKNSRCEKKVELVGGYFLCLAEAQPDKMGAF